MTMEDTSDSSKEAVIGTSKVHGLVIVVHISVGVCTVAMVIRNGAIPTPKVVDAIFLAVSVHTAPIPQRVAFKQRPKLYLDFSAAMMVLFHFISLAWNE